ncbi:hypothetical protein KC19_4G045000 [Ceratodon purpureus]|uniref:Uncharacterized protein n=1 Tax=Ceratodon purpureus TaxID=3225 RepID=A0A8T0I539_CERPU|nr:hypothetical protein KC19_4G045000 [Ceratodon purpureus]
MDHKRGYDYLEDQAVPSPTKRLKDLSHHRDYPSVTQDSHSSRPGPQLGERYNAQVNRSQYKTQIQYGCPQVCHGRQTQPVHAPEATPVKVEIPTNKLPTRPVWIGGQRGSDLEKKMEEVAYHSMLPVVKKELEKWAFFSNRAPKRVPTADASSDDPDDETTCAVCRNPRKFKGWDALLIHAQKYSKQMPWQHRGYHRALQEALFERKVADHKQAASADEASTPSSAPGKSCGKPCADITHKMDAEHLKQTAVKNANWRPDILIVENEEFNEVGYILKKQQELDQQQGGQKPQLREILAVYTNGDGNDEQRHVFVFPASKVGYVGETEVNSFRQSDAPKKENLSWQLEETHAAEMEVSDVPRISSEMVSSSNCMTSDVARCESLKEALGLQLTLDDPDDTPGKKLFDLEQIHRASSVVDRWTENFKSSEKRFEMQRVFRDSPELVAIDEGFRADLKRIRTYSPGCKRKIKEHMSEIEDRFREDHLMWLQQVEEVREQFQELADDMQHQE